MDAVNFILDEVLMLVPILLLFGKMLKRTPKVKDWLIPYILLLIGIILSVLILGFSSQAILQGILITSATVFSHQLFKQATIRDGEPKG